MTSKPMKIEDLPRQMKYRVWRIQTVRNLALIALFFVSLEMLDAKDEADRWKRAYNACQYSSQSR